MNSLYLCGILAFLGSTLAAHNALFGYDVLMRSDPDAPVLVNVNDKGEPIDSLGGPAISICMYVYMTPKAGKAEATLFGYSSKEKNYEDEMLFYLDLVKNITGIYMPEDSRGKFTGIPAENDWTFVCFTWDSPSGDFILYFNGEEVGRDVISKGNKIGGQGFLSMGQNQGGFATGYKPQLGWNGKMTQINVWSQVISADQVKEAMEGKTFGDMINWKESTWSIGGNCVILPSEVPNADSQKPGCGGDEQPLPSTDLSVSLRFNGDSLNDEAFKLFSYENKNGKSELALTINANGSTILYTGEEGRSVPHLEVRSGLQHWFFTWSDDVMKVYIDGGLYDTLTDFPKGTQMSMDGDLFSNEVNSRKRVRPKSAEYEVWERALSAEEVADNYRSKMQGSSPKAYVIASWAQSDQSSTPYVRQFWKQPYAYLGYTLLA